MLRESASSCFQEHKDLVNYEKNGGKTQTLARLYSTTFLATRSDLLPIKSFSTLSDA